jgi:hypothetical protein
MNTPLTIPESASSSFEVFSRAVQTVTVTDISGRAMTVRACTVAHVCDAIVAHTGVQFERFDLYTAKGFNVLATPHFFSAYSPKPNEEFIVVYDDKHVRISDATIERHTNGSWDLVEMSRRAGPVETWDTAWVTDMSNMLLNNYTFNDDISMWNTSNVCNMAGAFMNARSFNRDIRAWDVSRVTDMECVFNGAMSFDYYVGGWDIQNVDDIDYAFDSVGTHQAQRSLASWVSALSN